MFDLSEVIDTEHTTPEVRDGGEEGDRRGKRGKRRGRRG